MNLHYNPSLAEPEDIERWKQQAESGDVSAQVAYAFVYYRGERTTRDYALARKWFTAAARNGHIQAKFFLGAMLENGWGGKLDLGGAAALYLSAATAGYMPAQHNLGMLFQEGRGVPKNLAEAYYWLSVAAANGSNNSEAVIQQLIGQMTPQELAYSKQCFEARRKISDN
jgi:TPR repeat protein